MDRRPFQPMTRIQRLAPVLKNVSALGTPVSIDSMKAQVVSWALEEGAQIANDVWGLQRDPDMARVIAERNVPVIIMHNRETVDPAIDVVKDTFAFFTRSLEIAARANIPDANIVLDPGIGFGKTPQQSMIALARLRELEFFGLPILVGASRKTFIDSVSPGAAPAAYRWLVGRASARRAIMRTHHSRA